MIDTLDIGKYIYNSITNDASINVKAYPLVADNNAKYPFVVYRRVNLISSTCKDGVYEDEAVIELIIVSDKYSVGVDIAQAIRRKLERQCVIYEDLEINDGNITLATEEWSENAYVQRIQFTFKINKKN